MKNKKHFCPIWGETVTHIRRTDRDAFVVEDSPRIGGDYEITAQAIKDVKLLDQTQKAKLAKIINDLRKKADCVPTVTSDLVELVRPMQRAINFHLI